MSDDHDDHHPELSGYEPHEGRPLRSRRTVNAMRLIVLLGILGLVLPGIVTTVGVASRTANTACADWVSFAVPDAEGFDARFELFGPGVIGWECYSVGAFGGDGHVVSLGLIPSARVAREVVQNRSDA
jgi:hypothetical protein